MNDMPTGLPEDIFPGEILVGDLDFDFTLDGIQNAAQAYPHLLREVLDENGDAKVLSQLTHLFESVRGFESMGLSGERLIEAVATDASLLEILNRYFYFLYYADVSWARKISRLISRDGQVIPPRDFIVGRLPFAITFDSVESVFRGSNSYSCLRESETVDGIIIAARTLFDGIVNLESRGLRGDILLQAIADDAELLPLCQRYYGFVRDTLWGYRLNSFLGFTPGGKIA